MKQIDEVPRRISELVAWQCHDANCGFSLGLYRPHDTDVHPHRDVSPRGALVVCIESVSDVDVGEVRGTGARRVVGQQTWRGKEGLLFLRRTRTARFSLGVNVETTRLQSTEPETDSFDPVLMYDAT
jgi:hypothetical protein